MIIDCIADLHGHYPKLEGGDLLIVAGDLTAQDRPTEYVEFARWLTDQSYRKIVWISGNHDALLSSPEGLMQLRDPIQGSGIKDAGQDISYLCDSGTEFALYPTMPLSGSPDTPEMPICREKVKVWGSPWTLKFPGMNPKCMAFTCDTEEELAAKWALIPDDTDILVTHGPPFGVSDSVRRGPYDYECVGSRSLAARVGGLSDLPHLKMHVFGHIHECGGEVSDGRQIPKTIPGFFDVSRHIAINCSLVNERYEPVNAPVRVVL